MDDALRLQLEIDQICRVNLATFVYCAAPHMIEGGLEPNWHLDALGCAFGRVVQPGPMRLLVAMPPRYCKTFIGSICTTAWLLGQVETAFGAQGATCWSEHAWNPRSDHPALATGDSVRHGTLGEGVITRIEAGFW